jgi:hypothetical protein
MTKRDIKKEIDKALDLVGGYVTELRDLLRQHYTDLNHATGVWPEVGPPQASADPQHAGRIHRLIVASDHFINAVRGNH